MEQKTPLDQPTYEGERLFSTLRSQEKPQTVEYKPLPEIHSSDATQSKPVVLSLSSPHWEIMTLTSAWCFMFSHVNSCDLYGVNA